MTNNSRARPSDQALAVPVEPVSRLDPTGFDPSRGSFVEHIARAMFDCYQGYNAETQEMMWQQARYGLMHQAERALAAMREPAAEMLQGACEKHIPGRPMHDTTRPWPDERYRTDEECPLFVTRRRIWQKMIDAAIAMETQRAETENTGSIADESAVAKPDAHPQPGPSK